MFLIDSSYCILNLIVVFINTIVRIGIVLFPVTKAFLIPLLESALLCSKYFLDYFPLFWRGFEIGRVSVKPTRKNGCEDIIQGIEGIGDKVRK